MSATAGGLRQRGPLFGVSHSATHRVIDTLGPLLAPAPVSRRPVDQIAIVDGTLIPIRDHRLAAPSKNYRYSTNHHRFPRGELLGKAEEVTEDSPAGAGTDPRRR